MKDLAMFGTEAYPVHPSAMRNLVLCPWRAAMEYLHPVQDEGGQAGDTGSATHAAVHAFHKGLGLAACLEAMGARVREYPKADMTDAAGLFLAYARDHRNVDARVLLAEHPVSFTIAPAAHDPTQAPIQVEGTLDQVRDDGPYGPRLYDLKTSKKDPHEVLLHSVFQIAAYCVGASIALNRVVQPGALIMPRRYKSDGSGAVFHFFAWTFDDVPQILEGVRNAVADIRAGRIHHVPSADCVWCPARTPDVCLPKLRRTMLEVRK